MNEDLRRIEAVLDERVRPALRAHGGEIEIDRLKDGVLYVKLLGQCAGCPSADLTSETVVEAELVKALPELVRRVAVVQTVSDELWEQAKKLLREHHLLERGSGGRLYMKLYGWRSLTAWWSGTEARPGE